MSGGVWGGWVYALACLDPGSGPQLYAGGSFFLAGSLPASRVARWDGSSWAALEGPFENGVGGPVSELVVVDDGGTQLLYAGGEFATAGGIPANNIARWDGAVWSALEGPAGNGVDGSVSAMAAYNPGTGPELYVAGEFATAGGVPTGALARWNGASWPEVPGFAAFVGEVQYIRSLFVHDDGRGPALYVAAYRLESGTGTLRQIVVGWDGTSWASLVDQPAASVGGPVVAMTSFDSAAGPALWLGGGFLTIGGHAAAHVAAYQCDARLFADEFETGTADAWTLVVP